MTMPGFIIGFVTITAIAFEDGLNKKGFLIFLMGAPLAGAIGGVLFIPAGLVYLIWSAFKIDCDETGSKAKM